MADRSNVLTDEAPKPLAGAPYSQAVTFGDLVWTSGQIPIDPATGKLVEGGVAEQTRQTLRNVDAVLRAAGSESANVVKTLVFLSDMGDWPAMNEAYAEAFGASLPARSAVQVGLPEGILVEIEAVAHR